MSKHTVNPVREIRQRSISYLQRVLLSPSLLNADQATLPFVFDKILFPIMDEVLKPASMERDPGGFAETRTKAATAMCKAFLQYHVNLGPEQVGLLFGRLLDRMERFMKGERDMLVCAFRVARIVWMPHRIIDILCFVCTAAVSI